MQAVGAQYVLAGRRGRECIGRILGQSMYRQGVGAEYV